MINPFKISDYFIPISNFLKRNLKIFYRNIIFRYKRQTYLENKKIDYAYINSKSWIKIDYEIENLVYLKFENYYYFNHNSSIIINLQNFEKDKITLLFKGINEEIVYEIRIENFIKTDFSTFRRNIKTNTIRIAPKLSFTQLQFIKGYQFNLNHISIKTNRFKIKTTNYNKSDYVK